MPNRLARTLLEVLIDNAFPARDLGDPEFVSFREVADLFFENAGMVRGFAESSGHEWWPDCVKDADDWLIAIAEDGYSEGVRMIRPGLAEELWRRWQYVIVASMLEAEQGKVRPALTLPRNIPDALKGMAVIVYFLAGEGRNYSR